MTTYNIKQEYKLRMFYKDILNNNGLIGKIEIRKGKEEYVIEQLRKNLKNLRKLIVEVI